MRKTFSVLTGFLVVFLAFLIAATAPADAQSSTDFTLPGSDDAPIGGIDAGASYSWSMRYEIYDLLSNDAILRADPNLPAEIANCQLNLWLDANGWVTRLQEVRPDCSLKIKTAMLKTLSGEGFGPPPATLQMPVELAFAGNKQAAYEAYVNGVISAVIAKYRKSETDLPDPADASFELWVGASGTITRLAVAAPGSNWRYDGPLQHHLLGTTIDPPPAGLKMPIWEENNATAGIAAVNHPAP